MTPSPEHRWLASVGASVILTISDPPRRDKEPDLALCLAPGEGIAGAIPSRSRFRLPSAEGVNNKSEIWSVRRRLISSGMLRSKERSPASTCPTGISSLTSCSCGSSGSR